MRTRAASRAGLVLAALLVLAAPAAAGESPYRLSATPDLAAFALSGAATVIPMHYMDRWITPSCPCDPAGLNGLDRSTAGRSDATASRASNVLGAASLALPFVFDALDARAHDADWRRSFATDAVVLMEAAAVNEGLNELVKVATGRARPYVYGRPAGDPALTNSDSYTSFYSAHTSAAFAVGIAYARTYALRHPDSPSRKYVYGAAVAVPAAVGVLRVLAGKHFPTDALAGAAAGTAVGWLVPALHRREDTGVHAGVVPLQSGTAAWALRLDF